jgi:hypothetical protein
MAAAMSSRRSRGTFATLAALEPSRSSAFVTIACTVCIA